MLAAALTVGTLLAQNTLLEANFNDGSKTGWLNSSGSGGVSVDGANRLSITAGRHALTYFPQTGAQSVTASFDLSFTQVGTNNGGFRVGLFNSQGNLALDRSNTGFSGYKGYVFTWNPNPGSDASNGLRLLARTSGNLDSLISTTSTTSNTSYSEAGSGGGPSGQIFQTNTTYRVSYTINRGAGDELAFALSVTGGTMSFANSFNVSIPVTSTFDSFALYSVNNTEANPTLGSNFEIDNVLITAVPEPSTYAAVAGAAVLGLAFWRRRRAAAKALAA